MESKLVFGDFKCTFWKIFKYCKRLPLLNTRMFMVIITYSQGRIQGFPARGIAYKCKIFSS